LAIGEEAATIEPLGGDVKVILANPRGFCAGVNMAIESLDKVLDIYGPPIYVFHEIVHNRPVVERFQRRGAVFVNEVKEVPEGSILMYSAHGVSPEVHLLAKAKKLRAIDATCPLVTKVHLEAIRFSRQGYSILLIGHEGHDEVLGTMGEVPKAMHLIQSVEDAQKISLSDSSKIAYLTQTTLSVDDANKIIGVLKQRFPHIIGPPREDICYATQNRQEAVHSLAPEADLVLVLGSTNSSNSQRLVEIARDSNKEAYLIDGVEQLRSQWFEGVQSVLITAGASAPENVVQRCVDYLEEHFEAQVEERVLRKESTHFAMPKELRATALHGIEGRP